MTGKLMATESMQKIQENSSKIFFLLMFSEVFQQKSWAQQVMSNLCQSTEKLIENIFECVGMSKISIIPELSGIQRIFPEDAKNRQRVTGLCPVTFFAFIFGIHGVHHGSE